MGIYLYTPIYEREKKILYLLKLKGMTRLGYWLPQFIVDYSIFVINSLMFFPIFFALPFFTSIFVIFMITFLYFINHDCDDQ